MFHVLRFMIMGHQKHWQFLKKLAELEKIPHALLFYGQEKLGKKTLAIEFVKFLDCQNPEIRPCQNCRSCQDIQKKQHPDLMVIEPIKKEIQIFQIRELIWKLSLHSYSAPFKVAIIDRAHLMNQEAQNSLLKTLEEPKGKTLLILVSEYPEMLFPTILSRVQKIKFCSVEKKEIENFLKKEGFGEKESEEIIKLSLGRPGEIMEFVLDPQKFKNQKKLISDLVTISNSDLALRFQYAKELTEEDRDLKEILKMWLRYFRDILILNFKKPESKIAPTHEEDLNQFHKYSFNKIKNILKLIQKTNFLISNTNVNPRLSLEILLMEL